MLKKEKKTEPIWGTKPMITLPEPTLANSIELLGERIEGLTYTMMDMEANAITLAAGMEQMSSSLTYLANMVDILSDTLYSESQSAGIADVMAAMVMTLDRQNRMWETLTGTTPKGYKAHDDDED
jgi:hypothetical protein